MFKGTETMSNNNSIVQFLKFGIVGLSNTFIAFSVYYAMLWLGVHYVMANFFGWCIGVFNAFYWNNKYVFKSTNNWQQAILRTYISYAVTLVIGTSLLYALVEMLGISEYYAPFFSLIVSTPINFMMNKHWSFKK